MKLYNYLGIQASLAAKNGKRKTEIQTSERFEASKHPFNRNVILALFELLYKAPL